MYNCCTLYLSKIYFRNKKMFDKNYMNWNTASYQCTNSVSVTNLNSWL